MDHDYIDENNLVELYALGRLPTDEQVRVEQHFAECSECLEQLELAADLGNSLRAAAAEDVETALTVSVVAAVGRWLRRPLGVAVLLGSIAVIALPLLWLTSENRRLAGDLERLRQPLANVPSLLLTLARDSGSGQPAAILEAAEDQAWLKLAIEVTPDPQLVTYEARLVDAEERTLWDREGLEPDLWEVLQFTFPREILPPGDYRLELGARTVSGRPESIGSYAFRIVVP